MDSNIISDDSLKILEKPPEPWIIEMMIDGEVTKTNIDSIIDRILDVKIVKKIPVETPLTELEIIVVCRKVKELFIMGPILLELLAPITIVADIHGQLLDIIRWFQINGNPDNVKYLFLGNYINRGPFSIETLMLLFCYMIKHPRNIYMLRGNHESSMLTKIYGFYDDCNRRYNKKIYKLFLNLFNIMPLAAVISEKIFCVHGGLSPDLHNIDQIRKLPRPVDIHDHGFVYDLLWADLNRVNSDWAKSDRSMVCAFGHDPVVKFLKKHEFDMMVRGHELLEEGFEFYAKKKVVSLFSVPNYCGEFDNNGAIMTISESLVCSLIVVKSKYINPNNTRTKLTHLPN